MLQLDILERDLRSREQYWHRQEQAEQQLAEDLGSLSQELHNTPGKDMGKQVSPTGTKSVHHTHWPR